LISNISFLDAPLATSQTKEVTFIVYCLQWLRQNYARIILSNWFI